MWTTSLLIWLLVGLVFAQQPTNYGRVVGFVVDAEDHTPLPQANILLSNTSLGTVSRADGFFSIDRVPPGTYALVVSILGYRKMVVQDLQVQAGGIRAIRVKLNRQPISLGDVNVEAKRETHLLEYEKPFAGHEILTPRIITRQPGALDDAYRALATSPAVVTRNDINTQLYIRGGSPDQNLILYDGIEITTPSRLFILMGGGISLVNPDVVAAIDLQPAGFGVGYGNKMSALMQISNREGRRDHVAVNTSAAMVTARAIAEGPLGNGQGSWLLAGRRSFYDLLANSLYHKDYIFPFYYDVHAKLAYDVAPSTRLTAFYTYLGEGAQMYNVESEQLDLLNAGIGHIAGVKLHTLFSPKLAGNLLVGFYDDRNDIKVYDTFNYRYHAHLHYKIERITIKSELEYSPQDWFQFTAGTQLIGHHSDLLWNINWRNELDLPDSITFFTRTTDNAAFWQFRLRPQRWFEYTAGLRYDYSSRFNEAHWQPRNKLLLTLSPAFSLWLSYGQYCQFPDFLTVISRGEPMDIASNIDHLGAELAQHGIVGWQWSFSKQMSLKTEFYHKQFDHLLVNPEESFFIPANSGVGRARGVEVTLQRQRDDGSRLGYWATFTMAETKYKRTKKSRWEYFDYNQRYQAGAGVDWRLSKHWNLNLIWHYGSGFPYTPVLAVQRDLEEESGALEGWRVLKGEKNSARYDDYSRLDLRLSYLFDSPRWNFSAYVDLINVLNQRNIYMYDWRFEKNGGGNGYARRSSIYMLPFMPSFGLSLGF